MEGPIAATGSDSGTALESEAVDADADADDGDADSDVADAASDADDASLDGGPSDGSFACGEQSCASGDACVLEGGKTYSCMPMNGCSAGCACLAVVLGCLGGTCGTESGHLLLKCP